MMYSILTRFMCFLGVHKWKRSKFVALGNTVAPKVCQKCGKVSYGD